ncbi:MAG: hypothetical protein NTY83_00130 [Candidatus Micrarchaeota archaeon]|nr:hypothetical protein [Candidatus Micrarchaeota archaeon]
MQDCIGNSCVSRCTYPSSSWPYPPERPMLGTRKVLLVLSDPQRPDHPAPSRESVEKMVFGPDPSVREYYLENSQGKFTIEKAGVFGWYTTDYPVYGDDLDDSDHDGFLHYDQARWVEALRRVDREFNFAAYDTDRNGVLEVDELAIHFLTPESNEVPGGALRGISSQETPTWEPLVLDGVRIDAVSDAGTGTPLSVGASAHEISHLILGSPDMYFNFFLPYAAGAYSVMDQHGYSPHFDPYHKMEYGWVTPKVISGDGCYLLDKVESSGEVLLYYDPHRGKDEYFLFENRQIGEYYDFRLPDTGLGVWQIITDPDVYGNLPPPKFVPRSDWETVWEGDFGHRGIRQIRPVYGPPFDDSAALWDSSNLANGPADFYWADGTRAFTLTSISFSREQMYFEIELAD